MNGSTRSDGSGAFGRAGRRVWAVRVRFGDGEWQRVDTLPAPIQIRDRFWIVPSDVNCPDFTVEALGRGDRVLSRKGTRRPPGVDEGEPDPYAAC